jgi:hypothetical protein
MNIRIEAIPKELKSDVIKIGGVVNYYEELDECIMATFFHHELKTHGDHVVITDDLTGGKFRIAKSDFHTIEVI